MPETPSGTLTVFTGARSGASEHYAMAAADFARAAVRRGYRLVFGGGNVGLMGVVASAALAGGGEVIGVMPESMAARETPHPGLTRLEMVPDLHARKARMAALGDAFIALPGGAGTLEEFFEIWTWQQLGLHTKPVALFNAHGFWDPLVTMLDHMTAQGFIREQLVSALVIDRDPHALLDQLQNWRTP